MTGVVGPGCQSEAVGAALVGLGEIIMAIPSVVFSPKH